LTLVKKLENRVAALLGDKGEAAEFHRWLRRDADFKSWISVIGELTKDEQMPLARAITALKEGATLESLPQAERAAWVKAYGLYKEQKDLSEVEQH
jgi:hypothetical protein